MSVCIWILARRGIIKIQDQEDFNKHVLNSKKPVVIDFFATYVSTFQHLNLSINYSSQIFCLY